MVRIAWLPMLGFNYLPGESNFLLARQMARHWVEHRGAFVYMFVPKVGFNQVSPEPGIKYVFEDEVGCFYDTQADCPATFLQLFNPRCARIPVDAVMTSRSNAGAFLARQLWDHRGQFLPVFIDEPIPADFGNSVLTTCDYDLMSRALAYASCHTFFDSPAERDMALRASRRYLTATAMKMIEEKYQIRPLGFDWRNVDELTQGVRKADKFTITFGGRLNSLKQTPVLLDLYSKMFRGGRDVRIIVCCPKAGMGGDWDTKKYPEIEFKFGCPRPEFLQTVAAGHVVVNTSTHEGFSVGLVEQMYLSVVLLPDKHWVKNLLGEEGYKKYPFLYANVDGAAALLRSIFMMGYEKARELVAWVPEYLRDRYDSVKSNTAMYDHMEKVVTETKIVLRSKNNTNLLESVLADMLPRAPFTVTEFYDHLVETSDQYDDRSRYNARRGKMSIWYVWKWLKTKMIDSESTPEPTFYRPDQVEDGEKYLKPDLAYDESGEDLGIDEPDVEALVESK